MRDLARAGQRGNFLDTARNVHVDPEHRLGVPFPATHPMSCKVHHLSEARSESADVPTSGNELINAQDLTDAGNRLVRALQQRDGMTHLDRSKI